jgi:hypothetical protein
MKVYVVMDAPVEVYEDNERPGYVYGEVDGIYFSLERAEARLMDKASRGVTWIETMEVWR